MNEYKTGNQRSKNICHPNDDDVNLIRQGLSAIYRRIGGQEDYCMDDGIQPNDCGGAKK